MTYPGHVPGHPAHERPPRILPSLILFGVGALVVVTIVGWVIGAVLAAVRVLLVVALVLAVIWALASMRSDR